MNTLRRPILSPSQPKNMAPRTPPHPTKQDQRRLAVGEVPILDEKGENESAGATSYFRLVLCTSAYFLNRSHT